MIKELYVYKMTNENGSMKFVGILENYESVIWHEKFFDKGEFEIAAPLTLENLNLIKTDYMYFKYDPQVVEEQTFMRIKEITITSDEEKGDNIVAKGTSGSEFLEKRIVWEITKFIDKNICDVINTLVAENCGSYNDDYSEKLINYGEANGVRSLRIYFLKKDAITVDTNITIQITGKNLLEIVKQLCKENKLGFKINHLDKITQKNSSTNSFTMNSNLFTFKLLKPTDRSGYIIFSDDYDNIHSASYVKNITNQKNTALLAGSGEGAERERYIFYKEDEMKSYFDRNEVYIDLRDSDKGDMGTNDYIKSLKASAAEQFGDITEAFDTELFTDGVFKFEEDFFLGDYVTINKYGMTFKAQVIENIESIDENGYRNTPIFAY